MSNIDYMEAVYDKYQKVKKEYGETEESLVNKLNKFYQGDNHIKIPDRVSAGIQQAIRKRQKSYKYLKVLDSALDKYIASKQAIERNIDFKDVYKYITQQKANPINQPNPNFWKCNYYFMIRRSYSAENEVTISVIKISSHDQKVISYRSFRYSEILDSYYVSEGFVFINSPQTIAISGIAKPVTYKKMPELIEHIHLNISAPIKEIYNGIYLGSCFKNYSYTPFATRICFIPVCFSSSIDKKSNGLLEKFAISFPINDCKKDYNELILSMKEQYKNLKCYDKGCKLLQQSLEAVNITMQELVETRITNQIDDRDCFGGLREFHLLN